MDAEILQTFGKIAGIGGLSLGVVLLIFKDVIAKNEIFSRMTKAQTYRLLMTALVLIWLLGIAGIATMIVTGGEQMTQQDPSPNARAFAVS